MNQANYRPDETWLLKSSLLAKHNPKNIKILDLGGASGYLPKEIIDSNQCYCLDQDVNALETASQKGYQTIHHDLNIYQPLHFDNQSFDIIIAFDVLEHLIDPTYSLNELHRVLKSDGLLLMAFPNSVNFINRICFLLGKSYDITDTHHLKGKLFSDHLHCITLDKIQKLVSSTSFKTVEKSYFLQQNIRHQSLKKFQFILKLMHILRLHQLFPSLFCFSFIFTCRKSK